MGTIWCEVTPWRGFYLDRTLFGPVIRVGCFGFGVSKFVLTAWIDGWRTTLAKFTGKESKE